MCQCIFRFYSKSANAVPGKGTGEGRCRGCDYSDLPQDFRRSLSNFAEQRMVVDEYEYTSVEQCYHTHKYSIMAGVSMEEAYDLFSNKSPAESKRMTSRSNLRGDVKRWDMVSEKIMKECVRSKFSEEPSKSILIATKSARLSHVSRGVSGDAFNLGRMLEEERSALTA